MKKIAFLLTFAAATGWLVNVSKAAQADPVLDDYVQVSQALANDDLNAAQKSAKALASEATAEKQSDLAEQAAKIAASGSLDEAREHFKAASQDAVTLAAGKDGYHVMTCPMAKADWVQKATQVNNPYLGQAMPHCGSVKSTGGASAGQQSVSGGCCSM